MCLPSSIPSILPVVDNNSMVMSSALNTFEFNFLSEAWTVTANTDHLAILALVPGLDQSSQAPGSSTSMFE